MSDGDDKTDARRFRAIAEVAKSLGMRVAVLRVGDVHLQLAEPWGAPAGKVESKPLPPDEERTAKLRQAARRSLGYIPPDEQLEKLAPALGVA